MGLWSEVEILHAVVAAVLLIKIYCWSPLWWRIHFSFDFKACIFDPLSLCVSGQTPGGDVEAAGQSGGSHSHGSRDARLAWGRRRVGGKFKGQQSPAGAPQSPGGKVDCMVHFLPHFPTTRPVPHPWNVRLIDVLRVPRFIQLNVFHYVSIETWHNLAAQGQHRGTIIVLVTWWSVWLLHVFLFPIEEGLQGRWGC